tara:strand:+ start:1883 stop:2671 length:789 start_codon:yes stop_codon:yes gene_type:complete
MGASESKQRDKSVILKSVNLHVDAYKLDENLGDIPERGELTIVLRGFLYKKRSSFANLYKKIGEYEIDYKQVETYYDDLVRKLSRRYTCRIVVISYDTTPIEIQEKLRAKGYELFLIPERGSQQFTGLYSFLSKNDINTPVLILRNDLEMSNKYIAFLANINYQKNNQILIYNARHLSSSNVVLNDTVHIVPASLIEKFKNWVASNKRSMHTTAPLLRLGIFDKLRVLRDGYEIESFVKNNDYEIYRGEKTEASRLIIAGLS